MTVTDLVALVEYCIPVGVLLGAGPVLVMVFLGLAVRTFEDVAED